MDRYQTVSEVIVDLERSQLSAPLPSFAKLDSAMQDPVVAKRLTAPIEMTLPDLRVKQLLEEKMAKERELWHLRYKNAHGVLCKSKTTFADIVTRLKSGKLTADADASRAPKGKFKPLSQWPEFQPALAGINGKKAAKRKKPLAPETTPFPWRLYALGGLGIGVALLIAVVYLLSR